MWWLSIQSPVRWQVWLTSSSASKATERADARDAGVPLSADAGVAAFGVVAFLEDLGVRPHARSMFACALVASPRAIGELGIVVGIVASSVWWREFERGPGADII